MRELEYSYDFTNSVLSTLLRLRLIKTITVHNFAYLKNDLINYIVHLSQRKFSSNCFNNHNILFSFTTHFKSSSPTTSRESRLVVDKDDTGKFRFERVNPYTAESDYGRGFFWENISIDFLGECMCASEIVLSVW